MDPVSVFNALYDTKCIKFGTYVLKSGLVAPYYINLRRLPLYPELMEAVVTQVADKFLTKRMMTLTMSQLRMKYRRSSSSASRLVRSTVLSSISKELEKIQAEDKQRQQMAESADSDSQLGEEDLETCSEDCDWESVGNYSLNPVISAVPYGAIPIASAAALKSKLPFLFERKEIKPHGDQQPLLEDFNEATRNVYPAGRDSDDGEAHEDDQQEQTKQQQVILIEDVICSGESILEAVKQLERQNLKVEFVICIIDREENGINLLLKQAGIHVLCLYKMSAILRVLEATGRISSDQFLSIRRWIDENQFQAIGLDPTQATAAAKAGAVVETPAAGIKTSGAAVTKPSTMIEVASN